MITGNLNICRAAMTTKKRDISNPETSVLIVDDSMQYSMVLQKILQGVFGYHDVTTVDNPGDAFKLISEDPEKFGMLFVDYNFPDGNTGGDLLNQLAKNDLIKDKVAFLITSEPTPDNMKAAINAGALGVVAKPFDREELKRQLEKARRAREIDEVDSF
ncbi:MAG: response regulator [Candidatus Dadabacteria bacterium]|nr:MAG: response regulator [Candidatus Dadabacteria bacterium]